MRDLFESLVALQERLSEAEISSAVVGWIAVGIWGKLRVTLDVGVAGGGGAARATARKT